MVKWRSVMYLAIFCYQTFVNNAFFMTFGAIIDQVRAFYQVTTLEVAFLSWVVVLADVVLNPLAIVVIAKLRLKGCLMLVAILHLCSALLKLLGSLLFRSSSAYYMSLAGQICIAFAQPITNAAPPQVSADHFELQHRALGTSIGSYVSLAALAFGFVFSDYIVGSDLDTGLTRLFYVQLGMAATGVLLSFVYKDPLRQVGDDGDHQEEKISVLESFLQLVKNRDFVLVAVSFSLCFGGWIALFSLLEDLVPEDTSVLSMLLQVSGGLLGSIVFGLVVDKTNRFKEMSIFVALGTTVTNIGFYLCLKYDPTNTALLGVVSFFVGLFSISTVPIFVETAIEFTYPIDEVYSGGMLLSLSNIVGAVAILAISSHPSDLLTGFLILFLCLTVSFLPVVFARKSLYKRHAYYHTLN